MAKHNAEETRRAPVQFAAIDPYVETNIVAPTEKKAPGRDMIEWGTGNLYPQYIRELYGSVTTLRTIIEGNVDFVAGDQVRLNVSENAPHFADGIMNKKGISIRDQIREDALDLNLLGGFALQVIRDRAGNIAEIYSVPVEWLRSNAENSVFYYCEKWDKKGPKDAVVLPCFMKDLDWAKLSDEEKKRHASSIFYVKATKRGTYPSPKFAAAVKACETERCIDDYHLNAINNGFEGSMIVNFNNGLADEQQQEEIEEDFNEKFAGHQNPGRIAFSWNPNKDAQTTITVPPIKDFGERYRALADHCRQQVYCAFRAVPSLFGLPTASGFSTEEYESAFKLYNRTQIQPMQRTIIEAYEYLLGPGILTIVPFSLGGETEDNIQ